MSKKKTWRRHWSRVTSDRVSKTEKRISLYSALLVDAVYGLLIEITVFRVWERISSPIRLLTGRRTGFRAKRPLAGQRRIPDGWRNTRVYKPLRLLYAKRERPRETSLQKWYDIASIRYFVRVPRRTVSVRLIARSLLYTRHYVIVLLYWLHAYFCCG